MINSSTIFIVNDIETAITDISSTLPEHSVRVIQNEEDGKTEFLLLQAQKAIKEAYIAENDTKYIILAGDTFRVEAQNSLLKVLEEPPANIIFIIITQSKNAILPTILSRVQLKYQKTKKTYQLFELNLEKLELKDLYNYLKQNQRISKSQLKQIIESILFTVKQQNIKLTQKQLDCFSSSIKLLELNSRPVNILTTLLLNLMIKR